MTNFTSLIDIDENTMNSEYDALSWFRDFVKPTTAIAGENEVIINTLMKSRKFSSYINSVRKDFRQNYSNLRKYPRFDLLKRK